MSINHLANKLGKYVQSSDDKKCIVQNLDWDAIKRTPQMIKQKANVGNHTHDLIFDQMKNKLRILEEKILSFPNYVSLFSETHISLIDDCKLIGMFTKELFDPYHSLSKSTMDQLDNKLRNSLNPNVSIFLSVSKQLIFEEEYYLWEQMEIYLRSVSQTEPAIRKELEHYSETMKKTVSVLLTLFKNINQHIKERNFKILDYDKLINSHNSLLNKQKTKELSIQEAKLMYNLERKIIDAKVGYEDINNLLKNELPIVFNYIMEIFESIQYITYYTQLTVYYQIYLNLEPISNAFQIDPLELKGKCFHNNLMEKYVLKNSQATDLINELSIFKLSSNSFNKYCEKDRSQNFIEPAIKYCKVLFNFTAAEPGDLSIKRDDIIEVLEHDGNWWRGKINGKVGIFPGNYVEMFHYN